MDNTVEIRHPDHPKDAPSSMVTQLQFDEIWKPRGFELVPAVARATDADDASALQGSGETPKAAKTATKTPEKADQEAKNG